MPSGFLDDCGRLSTSRRGLFGHRHHLRERRLGWSLTILLLDVVVIDIVVVDDVRHVLSGWLAYLSRQLHLRLFARL